MEDAGVVVEPPPETPRAPNCWEGTLVCEEGYRCAGIACVPDTGATMAECEAASLSPTYVTPNVLVFIDRSYSMNRDFGTAGTRWEVLRSSLLDPEDGLITSLQSQVNFGVALYSADPRNENKWDGVQVMECPSVITVPLGIDNYQAIHDVYMQTKMLWDTPTGESIEAVLDDLVEQGALEGTRTFFVVATDGEPDTCAQLDPQNGQPEAIAAVERAYSLGIQTYMISVGTEISTAHMQDMANAGLGPNASGAPFWVAGDDLGLQEALRSIVDSVLSCDVALDGTIVPETACEMVVKLNGEILECERENGWRLLDASTIELHGTACTELQSNRDAVLSVTVPCVPDVI